MFEDEPDRLELFREAWGAGFDEIVFASGEADEVYADQLVDAFIALARKRELAISMPTDMDDDQFNTWLRDDFVGYIREWRKQVLDLLTGGEAE